MKPKLSVVCVTNGEGSHVGRFLGEMRWMANIFEAELVLGLDGTRAQAVGWATLS